MAESLSLRAETTYDAVLLMDRVMATGTSLTDGLSRLFVAAALRVRGETATRARKGLPPGRCRRCLRPCHPAALPSPACTLTLPPPPPPHTPAPPQIAALQGESSDNVPSDPTLAAGSGFPPGTVNKMEHNVRAALGNDTSSISCLRCLKLYLERMGQDLADGAPLAPLHAGAYALLREAARAPALVGCRPSLVAAGVLIAARAAAGAVPLWPAALALLTGVRDAAAPELAVPLAAVEPLARAAAAAGALALPPGSIPIVGGAGAGPGGSSGGGAGSGGGQGSGGGFGGFAGSSSDLGGGQLWDAVRKGRGAGSASGAGRSSSGGPTRTGTPASDLSGAPRGGHGGGAGGASAGDLAALLHGALHGPSGPLPIPGAGSAPHLAALHYGADSLSGSPAAAGLRLPGGADPVSAAGLAAALSGLALGGAAGSPGAAAAAAAALAASAGLVGPYGGLGGFGQLPIGGLAGVPGLAGSPHAGAPHLGLGGMGVPGLLAGGAPHLDLPCAPLPAPSRLQHMTSARSQSLGGLDAAALLSRAPGPGPAAAAPGLQRHNSGAAHGGGGLSESGAAPGASACAAAAPGAPLK
jgi:hypothetical protein